MKSFRSQSRSRLLLLILILTMVICGYAATVYTAGNNAISLTAVAATGAGTDFSMPVINGQLPNKYTWQVIYTGTPTAITINFEGSLDDTNWDIVDQYTGTTSTGRSVVNKPYKFTRCNITSYTVNGSTTTCQFVATF